MTKLQEDQHLIKKLIWNHVLKFPKNEIFDFHNIHYWSDVNPYLIEKHYFQSSKERKKFYRALQFCICKTELPHRRIVIGHQHVNCTKL